MCFVFQIPISVESLVRGDFAAGAVLITFGVLLGKVNPQQILFISIVETIFFSLNEQIGLKIGAADIGGTMTIHMSATATAKAMQTRQHQQSQLTFMHAIGSNADSRACCLLACLLA